MAAGFGVLSAWRMLRPHWALHAAPHQMFAVAAGTLTLKKTIGNALDATASPPTLFCSARTRKAISAEHAGARIATQTLLEGETVAHKLIEAAKGAVLVAKCDHHLVAANPDVKDPTKFQKWYCDRCHAIFYLPIPSGDRNTK